jgi:uridine phosphorylase
MFQRMPHILLDKNMVDGCSIALLPGDPGRVDVVGDHLESVQQLSYNREFKSIRGLYNGHDVLVVSTGIGGPSTSICIEELAMLGVKTFIRIGTTGSISKSLSVGDMLIANAAVRFDGASKSFAPIEYPAVADFNLVSALKKAADELKFSYKIGICASCDSFYQGQSRMNTYKKSPLSSESKRLELLKDMGVLSFEMETATLFVQAMTYGLRAASILGVILNRNETESIEHSKIEKIEKKSIRVALRACALLFSD